MMGERQYNLITIRKLNNLVQHISVTQESQLKFYENNHCG